MKPGPLNVDITLGLDDRCGGAAMQISDISSRIHSALASSHELSRTQREESALARALERQRSGEAGGARDRLTIRLSTLRLDAAELRQTHRDVSKTQARRTISQTVQAKVGRVQGELEEMQRLADAVEAGEVTEDQLQDVQLMMESRMAHIDVAVSQAKFGGQQLITGETVRITTDSQTEEGFDVTYERVDSESLGLNTVDVVNQSSPGVAAELVEKAMEAVSEISGKIEREYSSQGTQLERQMGELQEKMAEMRSHERLNSPTEERWLGGVKDKLGAMTGDLRGVISSTRLDAGIVTSVLR